MGKVVVAVTAICHDPLCYCGWWEGIRDLILQVAKFRHVEMKMNVFL
jgi:hypothetical protein